MNMMGGAKELVYTEPLSPAAQKWLITRDDEWIERTSVDPSVAQQGISRAEV